MEFLGQSGSLSAFIQVILIDLVLAGDNAVVIGLAAAGLPPEMRRKAIIWGIGAATVLRILLAVITTQLLAIVGLLLAGGLLLLWVVWKMYEELRVSARQNLAAQEALEGHDFDGDGAVGAPVKTKTLKQAFLQILLADVSMSLDNVLAVAGAAREHPAALAFGLVLSIALMGFAAAFIARLLGRYHWIAYVGLVVIFIVAMRMIFHGYVEVAGEITFGLASVTK